MALASQPGASPPDAISSPISVISFPSSWRSRLFPRLSSLLSPLCPDLFRLCLVLDLLLCRLLHSVSRPGSWIASAAWLRRRLPSWLTGLPGDPWWRRSLGAAPPSAEPLTSGCPKVSALLTWPAESTCRHTTLACHAPAGRASGSASGAPAGRDQKPSSGGVVGSKGLTQPEDCWVGLGAPARGSGSSAFGSKHVWSGLLGSPPLELGLLTPPRIAPLRHQCRHSCWSQRRHSPCCLNCSSRSSSSGAGALAWRPDCESSLGCLALSLEKGSDCLSDKPFSAESRLSLLSLLNLSSRSCSTFSFSCLCGMPSLPSFSSLGICFPGLPSCLSSSLSLHLCRLALCPASFSSMALTRPLGSWVQPSLGFSPTLLRRLLSSSSSPWWCAWRCRLPPLGCNRSGRHDLSLSSLGCRSYASASSRSGCRLGSSEGNSCLPRRWHLGTSLLLDKPADSMTLLPPPGGRHPPASPSRACPAPQSRPCSTSLRPPLLQGLLPPRASSWHRRRLLWRGVAILSRVGPLWLWPLSLSWAPFLLLAGANPPPVVSTSLSVCPAFGLLLPLRRSGPLLSPAGNRWWSLRLWGPLSASLSLMGEMFGCCATDWEASQSERPGVGLHVRVDLFLRPLNRCRARPLLVYWPWLSLNVSSPDGFSLL